MHMKADAIHLKSLFENATEGIILTDGTGNIILVNPAAEKTFGYGAEELTGSPIEVLIPENVKPNHEALRKGFYHKPSNRVMGQGRDLFGKKKDGSNIPVEVSLSFYKKENELFVIAFIVDITQRKNIEQNILDKQKELENMARDMRKLNTQLEAKVEERTLILKEALQKLEESQKELSDAFEKEKQLSEMKSRFVSMASHEFRTPLSTVLSSATLLSKYQMTEEQDKRERHVDKIKNSVKHLNDLLEDFLSLGKLDEGKVETRIVEFEPGDLTQETLDEIKGLLKKDQQFFFDGVGKMQLFSDKKLFRNIIINLVSNAIKFSGEGSPINISVENDKEGRWTKIMIADQGIGIGEEDQLHLFSSFYRGKNAQNVQGTGLGLHIVKRYLDLIGGEITLKSKLGIGTTITITIPSLQSHASP